VPYIPGFVNQAQLAKAVEEAAKKLNKGDVVRVNHSIGADTGASHRYSFESCFRMQRVGRIH